MFLFNGKRMKRILLVFFLICFFLLCSCNKQVEQPQDKPQETYCITYVINGHGEQPENLVEQTNLPNPLPVLSEEGWTFEGWFTTSIFEPESKAVAGIELVENITLYAKWTEVDDPTPPPVKKYSITFVINGHGEQLENLIDQTNLPNPLPELSEEWWTFEGWYFEQTFKTQATAGDVLTKNITLYAKWSKIPTVVVDYKVDKEFAGTLIGETHQVIERGTDTTPVTVVTNIGYRFVGWMKGEGNYEVERSDEITRVDTNVQDNITAIAVFQGPITCYMDFRATQGGRVEGLLYQEVLYGGKGLPVTAIADEGFRFVRWSDGQTEAERENNCVTNMWGSVIEAEFERYKRDFKLEYNEATSNTELADYTFYLDDMEKEQYLPVPQRVGYEFVGWYSDWFHTVQVTDETGKMIVDRDWFTNEHIFYKRTNPDMKLFARWKPIKEVPTYKILLIYVTEIHAAFESTYYGTIQVDYVMSDFEKKRFDLIAIRLEEYLEAILNGTVDFQVDTYYTKEPLNEKSFYRSSTTLNGNKLLDDFVTRTEDGGIPEVNEMLGIYDSVLTLFHLNDYENKLHITGGSAGKKYGDIHLEFLGEETKYDLDLFYPGIYQGWVERISLFTHELTHTIEFQLQDIDYYGIHESSEYYNRVHGALGTEFDYLYDYLRNEFIVDDRNVGIPYEFWTGEYERK